MCNGECNFQSFGKYKIVKDKNDLRKSIGLKTTKNTIICCSCNKELVSIACDEFEWFRQILNLVGSSRANYVGYPRPQYFFRVREILIS